jgi:hypothetical protein
MVEKTLVTPAMVAQFSDPDEPILYQTTTAKLSRYNLSSSRTLIVTTEHLYVFESGKMSRKHKITNMTAFIKSTKSNECVLVFPHAKDLRLDGITDVQDLQSIVQLRFVNKNPTDTLRIYAVPLKSLKDFAQVNKYGFSNLPHDNCRVIKEEFLGTKDLNE